MVNARLCRQITQRSIHIHHHKKRIRKKYISIYKRKKKEEEDNQIDKQIDQ